MHTLSYGTRIFVDCIKGATQSQFSHKIRYLAGMLPAVISVSYNVVTHSMKVAIHKNEYKHHKKANVPKTKHNLSFHRK